MKLQDILSKHILQNDNCVVYIGIIATPYDNYFIGNPTSAQMRLPKIYIEPLKVSNTDRQNANQVHLKKREATLQDSDYIHGFTALDPSSYHTIHINRVENNIAYAIYSRLPYSNLRDLTYQLVIGMNPYAFSLHPLVTNEEFRLNLPLSVEELKTELVNILVSKLLIKLEGHNYQFVVCSNAKNTRDTLESAIIYE